MPEEGFFGMAELAVVSAPEPRVPQCGSCKLYESCQSPKMELAGRGKKKILVVGEAPGQTEDEKGKPFVGKAGRRLQRDMARVGLSLFEDCWVTNALICRPPKNRIPKDVMVDWCRPNLLKHVERLKPRTILLFGSHAVRSVVGHLWKEDPGGVGVWAGWQVPCRKWNSWIIPTYHPSFLERMKKTRRDGTKDDGDPVANAAFLDALRAAAAVRTRPWPDGPPRDESAVRLCLDPEDTTVDVQAFLDSTDLFAFDFETTTLKPDGPFAEIHSCSVSDGKQAIAFPWVGPVVDVVAEALASSRWRKIGYNAKFEQRWCRRKLGVRVRNWVWDGMIAAHLLDSRKGVTSLKFQAFARLGVEDYAGQVKPYLKASQKGGNSKNRIFDLDLETVLQYCALDSLYEFQVAKLQAEELGVPL